MNTKIIGTGSAVPSRVLDNAELSTFLDTSDEWIRTRTDGAAVAFEDRILDNDLVSEIDDGVDQDDRNIRKKTTNTGQPFAHASSF